MGFRESFFKNTVAFGAMLVSLVSFDAIKQRAEAETTKVELPIVKGGSHWRGRNYPMPRKAHSQVYLRQLAKERAIGIDPKYLHAKNSRTTPFVLIRREWLARSEMWDKANPVETRGRRYG